MNVSFNGSSDSESYMMAPDSSRLSSVKIFVREQWDSKGSDQMFAPLLRFGCQRLTCLVFINPLFRGSVVFVKISLDTKKSFTVLF